MTQFELTLILIVLSACGVTISAFGTRIAWLKYKKECLSDKK